MRNRQPFNERTKGMTIAVRPGTEWVHFPEEPGLFVEFSWKDSTLVKAEIVNDEFDFIGDFLGKVEVSNG